MRENQRLAEPGKANESPYYLSGERFVLNEGRLEKKG
jgi:hypothetical protein